MLVAAAAATPAARTWRHAPFISTPPRAHDVLSRPAPDATPPDAIAFRVPEDTARKPTDLLALTPRIGRHLVRIVLLWPREECPAPIARAARAHTIDAGAMLRTDAVSTPRIERAPRRDCSLTDGDDFWRARGNSDDSAHLSDPGPCAKTAVKSTPGSAAESQPRSARPSRNRCSSGRMRSSR